MRKKHLKAVPKPAEAAAEPVEGSTEKSVDSSIRICPPAGRKLIQQRIDEVRIAQLKLQDTVNAIGAGLGIDHENEKWDYRAETGVFIRLK